MMLLPLIAVFCGAQLIAAAATGTTDACYLAVAGKASPNTLGWLRYDICLTLL